MAYLKMSDLDLTNKRVLIREDLNVPVENGAITSDARIQAAVPTIRTALNKKAAVIILSHLGRPTEGKYEEEFSLKPVAERLSVLLGQEVKLVKDWLDGVDVKPGQIVICENVRFNVGEGKNNEALSQKMAKLCDVYVNDAFATAHRKEASTYGIAQFAPVACAGLLMEKELEALEKVMANPERPLLAIVAGSKVSTKLTLLRSIAKIVDYLIVGGGIANTFIAAAGYNVGASLYEPDLVEEAKQLNEMAKKMNIQIPLPIDVVVADAFKADANKRVVAIAEVAAHEMIVDVGPETQKMFDEIIQKAKTILWNGPVGVFEMDPFAKGTEALAKSIARSNAYSVAGGGDTVAAIEKFGVEDKISYISTAGGAFLTYLEGETLPAVAALEKSSLKGEK